MNEPREDSSGVDIIVWIVVCLLLGAIVIPNFIRARATSAQAGCINNLRQIDGAKNEWALENGKTNGTVATKTDIKPYIKLDSKGNIPHCPSGGIYTIGKVGENPTCSIGGPQHTLP